MKKIFYNPSSDHRKLSKSKKFEFALKIEDKLSEKLNIGGPNLHVKYLKKPENTTYSITNTNPEMETEIENFLLEEGFKILDKESKIHVYVLKHFPLDGNLDQLEERLREKGDDVYIERMSAYNKKTKSYSPSTLLKVITNFQILENKITAGNNIILQCENFIFPPLTCYNCNQYGHYSFNKVTKAKCPNDTTCAKCAGPHKTNQCTSEITKCSNCKDKHTARFSKCPIRLEYIQVTQVENKQKTNQPGNTKLNDINFPNFPGTPNPDTVVKTSQPYRDALRSNLNSSGILRPQVDFHQAISILIKTNENQVRTLEQKDSEILILKKELEEQKNAHAKQVADLQSRVAALEEGKKQNEIKLVIGHQITDNLLTTPNKTLADSFKNAVHSTPADKINVAHSTPADKNNLLESVCNYLNNSHRPLTLADKFDNSVDDEEVTFMSAQNTQSTPQSSSHSTPCHTQYNSATEDFEEEKSIIG